MIRVDELITTWAKMRNYIDHSERLSCFSLLVDMLRDDGWDQDGYLRDNARGFSEVLMWCDRYLKIDGDS